VSVPPELYEPVPWLPGAHLQTVVPALLRLPGPLGAPRLRRIDVGGGNAVRVDVNLPRDRARGTIVLIHGMGGSSESSYMRATARQATERGWVAARLNLRNCGGTAAWACTLYNAGQSGDVAAVLADLAGEPATFPRPWMVAGFSLGGNIALLYGGRAGQACAADAVAGVNAPIELERCLRALERRVNRPYERHYVRRLYAQLDEIRRVRPVPGCERLPGPVRTLRGFDDRFTAPDAGFGSAEAYYAASSAAAVLDRVARPTLLLSARNDPFVPVEMFAPWAGRAGITCLHPPAGGHCGYWQRGRPRNWAAQALVEFFERVSSAARDGMRG
jgi:predicted alpha/beta-fold hydrolase